MTDETTSWQPASVPRYRVLVVDDNEASARLLAMLLEKFWQHEVHVCHDGAAALSCAERVRPELVLLDIKLPGMSGLDVARALRGQAQFQKTLLVALTGNDNEEDRACTAAAGFDEHLVKPADVTALEPLFLHPKLIG